MRFVNNWQHSFLLLTMPNVNKRSRRQIKRKKRKWKSFAIAGNSNCQNWAINKTDRTSFLNWEQCVCVYQTKLSLLIAFYDEFQNRPCNVYKPGYTKSIFIKPKNKTSTCSNSLLRFSTTIFFTYETIFQLFLIQISGDQQTH